MVGRRLVKEAAKETVQGVGFDLLIACGFASDPHVSEEVKRYGKLTVQTARMIPDLAMGDELLKKTGADEPYEKLKRALRAEIDESAWSALYSTRSHPFDSPSSGKIAVKVINPYGDEVMKVFDLD